MSRSDSRWRRALSAAAGLSVVLGGLNTPAEAAGPPFSLVGDYSLPAGAGAFDVLPDGRLVVMVGDAILRQDSVNSSNFSTLGSVSPGHVAPFGAAFIRVSPGGDKIAIGDNESGGGAQDVLLLDLASLDPIVPATPTTIATNNYAAHWADNDTLFVSGVASFGSPGEVTRISAPTIASASATVVISGIGGFSGGVTTDGTHLYTANGFDGGPGGSNTGEIRAFELGSLMTAGSSVNFESAGLPIAEVLSGDSLGFDAFGNLLVGGGDFSQPDVGFAAVVDAAAIAGALGGGPIATSANAQQLVPGSPFDFYNIAANPTTGEVLVTFFGSDRMYRYAVPAPGVLTPIVGLAGFAVARRRRSRGA